MHRSSILYLAATTLALATGCAVDHTHQHRESERYSFRMGNDVESPPSQVDWESTPDASELLASRSQPMLQAEEEETGEVIETVAGEMEEQPAEDLSDSEAGEFAEVPLATDATDATDATEATPTTEPESVDAIEPTRSESPLALSRPRSGIVMDHAADYTWLQGRLEYSGLGGGMWKVRYAPISEDDIYGGSVVLDIDPSEQGFRAGETVFVAGRVVVEAGERNVASPPYEVEKLERIDRVRSAPVR